MKNFAGVALYGSSEAGEINRDGIGNHYGNLASSKSAIVDPLHEVTSPAGRINDW